MSAYPTMGRARNQRESTAAAHRANRFMVGASPFAIERQRRWQAEAEVALLLKQHRVTPHAGGVRVSLLRQRIGAALVRAGDRLLTGGLLMEIARVQHSDWIPQYPYPLYVSENPDGDRR